MYVLTSARDVAVNVHVHVPSPTPNTHIQFNSDSGMCQLTQSGRVTALAALLAELLFTRGAECYTLDDLLELYQQHFGVPLLLKHFGVDNIDSLMELPEINEVVELVDVRVSECPLSDITQTLYSR